MFSIINANSRKFIEENSHREENSVRISSEKSRRKFCKNFLRDFSKISRRKFRIKFCKNFIRDFLR